MLHLLVDTNCLLHFRPLNEIDLPSFLGVDGVQIWICPVVLRELDEKKVLGKTEKIRARATRVLRWLREIKTRPRPVEIRPAVFLDFDVFDNPPTAPLRPEINDDWLLTAAIAFKASHAEHRVAILTDDMSLQLKSETFSIEAVNLSERHQLPPETDDQAKRIRELEHQLLEAKAAMPKLVLQFPDGNSKLDVVVVRPHTRNEDEIAQAVEWEGLNRPMFDRRQALGTWGHLVTMGFPPTAADIKKYHDDRAEYLTKYPDYIRELDKFQTAKALVVEATCCIANRGGAPAEDVDVHLRVPEGPRFLLERELPTPPKPPKPPALRLPRNALSQFNSLLRHPRFPDLGLASLPRANLEVPNVTGPWRENENGLRLHIRHVKHGYATSLPPVRIAFPSFAEIRSLELRYELRASNLPSASEGGVHVVIRVEEAPAEDKPRLYFTESEESDDE